MLDPYDLAERVGPKLGTLAHPGDGSGTPPLPLALCGLFGPYELPEGISEQDREEMGIPSPEFPRLFLEALFHLMVNEFNVSFEDADELAVKDAAVAAREHKRNEQVWYYTECRPDEPVFRTRVKDFDTKHQVIPCEVFKAMQGRADCPHTSKAG